MIYRKEAPHLTTFLLCNNYNLKTLRLFLIDLYGNSSSALTVKALLNRKYHHLYQHMLVDIR